MSVPAESVCHYKEFEMEYYREHVEEVVNEYLQNRGEDLIMRITLNDVSQVWKKSREVHLPKNIASTVKHGRCYS